MTDISSPSRTQKIDEVIAIDRTSKLHFDEYHELTCPQDVHDLLHHEIKMKSWTQMFLGAHVTASATFFGVLWVSSAALLTGGMSTAIQFGLLAGAGVIFATRSYDSLQRLRLANENIQNTIDYLMDAGVVTQEQAAILRTRTSKRKTSPILEKIAATDESVLKKMMKKENFDRRVSNILKGLESATQLNEQEKKIAMSYFSRHANDVLKSNVSDEQKNIELSAVLFEAMAHMFNPEADPETISKRLPSLPSVNENIAIHASTTIQFPADTPQPEPGSPSINTSFKFKK